MFGPDIIRDLETRLQQLQGEEDPQEDAHAAIVYDLVVEYIATISKKLAFSPSVSVNLLPHTHLINYGGAYYSYLFAKMHAAQIWQNQFADDPLSRYLFLNAYCYLSFTTWLPFGAQPRHLSVNNLGSILRPWHGLHLSHRITSHHTLTQLYTLRES